MKRKRVKDEFEVEEILDKKYVTGDSYYKVKWVGYPTSEATWEPLKHLKNVNWIVEKFEAQLTPGTQNTCSTTKKFDTEKLDSDIPTTPIKTIEDTTKVVLKLPSTTDAQSLLAIDTPYKILTVTRDNIGLKVLIQWEPRGDGRTSESTWHYTNDLREYKHISRMLLNYYESIIE